MMLEPLSSQPYKKRDASTDGSDAHHSEPCRDSAFELLRDITAAANSSLILDDIFDALGEVLRQHFPYREATIAVFDETLNGIKLLVRMLENGLLDFHSEHNRFTGDDPLLRQLIFHPRSLHLNTREAISAVQPSIILPPWATNTIVVPLVNKGIMSGVLALSTDRESTSNDEDTLTSQHIDLLTDVTPPMAVAMENAKLYWQTQQQAGREFLVNQITKSIQQSLAVDDILSTATDTLGRTTGVSRCIIRYFNQPLTLGNDDVDDVSERLSLDSHKHLYQYSLQGLPRFGSIEIERLSLEEHIIYQRLDSLQKESHASTPMLDLASHLNPFILNDVQDCPSQFASLDDLQQHGIQSLAVFPICVGDGCVGTITLHQCDQVRVWLEEDLALFSAIAEHLGLALRQANLYAAQEAQTKKLQDTLDELQQAQLQLIQSEKMAVIGQFVAGIAHEVNTPLGAITSNQQTLKQCVDAIQKSIQSEQPISGNILTTMEKLLGVNELAATRMDEIVRNLRNFARLDESAMKQINLQESLHSTRLLLERPLRDAGITLTQDIQPDLPPVTCYPGLFNQVLMNVIVNAIHALNNTENPTITVKIHTHSDANELWVDVIDNGPGIPDSVLPKIFDPGFTTKGVGVGTGLGLALCYRIMSKHHGRIEVANTGSTGTTMRLALPI